MEQPDRRFAGNAAVPVLIFPATATATPTSTKFEVLRIRYYTS
jgi:alpha-beta hydrolase superfamily lysophospholipase